MSEIDDSLEKLTALCMGLEIPPSTAASMGAMGLKAIGTAIAEQAKKAGREDAELTRLLAVEAAAKDAINQCFCIAPENTIKCECCKAEAETLKDFPHKPTCPVLVINPIEE